MLKKKDYEPDEIYETNEKSKRVKTRILFAYFGHLKDLAD